eukprot:TRINITY_DN2426_c0_g1_i1.p1 TRINITY_DN2426_c0_g1~~TRINITY_DN2426_c0_g1_i1.p1  ORF type:complete len:273 (+),score=48.06 TRINITY_DN2426_c0_g1_i1:88-906(+)
MLGITTTPSRCTKLFITDMLRKKKYDDVKGLLESGATLLLKHGETNAGTELALLLIDVYTKANTPSNEAVGTLVKIFSNYKLEDHPKKKSFINTALKWSSKPENNNQGDPTLRTCFAHHFQAMQDYEVAQKHYLRSNDAEGFANMLIQWGEEVYPSEKDLLITRAVLMYLCLQNLKDANIIYSLFKNRYPALDTPLFNYTRFLLLTLERDALPLFDLLRSTYQKSLQRDPTFTQYLDQIANVFFGVPLPGNNAGMGGLLGSLMKSFFNEGDQ